MPGPISQNGNFYSNDASSPKIYWFQMLFKSVKTVWTQEEITYFAIAYTLLCTSLIMVTITSHIFINIFRPVHFSTVKFTKR